MSDATTAYARGLQDFMGLQLLVAPGALVPRAETELLGTRAVSVAERLRSGAGPVRVVDMCCGSGNLACAIAVHVPEADVWACDLTDECVELSRRNVEHLALAGRVRVRQGDLFGALSADGLEGQVDLVVCNPPYISSARLAQRSDLSEEPREAFDGGPYGLSIHQRVLREALSYLKPSGVILFEFGLGQDRQLVKLLERTRQYESVELVADAAGENRVVSARRKTQES
jgi:release factor glutamine methyltransferase